MARSTRAPRVPRGVLAVIACGGAAGSVCRWWLSLVLPAGDGFPWATLLANISGSLLLGGLIVLALEVWPPTPYLRPFVAVGFLGGYTTFSAYMLDACRLLVAGHLGESAAYVGGTLLAGLLACWAGMAAVRLAVRPRSHRAEDDWPQNATPPQVG